MMNNEEDEKIQDIRREYLKKIVKGVFFTTANSCVDRTNEDNSSTSTYVIRGEGTPLKDCSFKANDSKKYEFLFKTTFVDKKCRFEYKGVNSKQKEFNHEIALAKAVSLFKSYSIDLDYVFHSQAEKHLFSRLIYKYIKQLLNVLFDEYPSDDINTLNTLVREKYNKVLDKIRAEVEGVDIYELIYRNTHWSDAELITYCGINRKECDSIMLIENFFDIKKFDYIEDIDRCVHIRPSDRRTTYTYKEISYLSYELNMRNRLNIRYSPLDRYVSVELFKLSDECNKTIKLDKEKYVPRFVCIAFPKKDIEDELKAESKKDIDNPIIINSLEDLEKEVYDKLESNVQDYILKNYTAERKRYLTLTEQAVIIIEKILQVDYNSCFSDDKHIPAGFQQGFSRFRRFLKNQKIAIDKDTIVYKYLYSLWIDAFCYKKDVIEAFNQKVDVLKNETLENEFEYRLEKGRGPYAYLRTSLCEFKKYLEDAAANCMSSEQAHMSLG